MKGQKARTGVKIHPSFEGGQSDLTCRIPKSGFSRARWAEELTEVNLRDIVYAVRKKRLDPTKTITIADLYKASVFKKCEYGVKLLGKGLDEFKELGIPMNFVVSDAS